MKRLKTSEIATKGVTFLLRRPTATEVMWLNFAVTYLCNSRCVMCSIWKKYKEDPDLFKQELTLPEIEKLLQSRYLRQLQGISFTGGEPFLRDDFVELVGLFIEQYPQALLGIATNGLNTELIVRKMKEIFDRYNPTQRISISLSLDGIDATHDAMRGVTNAYTRVLETMETLQDRFPVNIGVDFTITPQNYRELLNAYQVSKEKGIKFLAGCAHSSCFYYNNEGLSYEWPEEEAAEPEAIVTELLNDKILNESFVTKLIDPYAYFMSRCLEYQRSQTRLFTCYSGTHSLFLDPYGNVYPCLILDKKFGNIRNEAFDTLWMSPQAEEVREHIKANTCHCWVACEAVPSLLRGFDAVKWNVSHKIFRGKRGP
jgi:MoaA/NifB/PqqE/SkfB family radical SAM enzyme